MTRIFNKKAKENKDTKYHDSKNVDTNSIVVSESRNFGGEYLCNFIWNELEMNSLLKKNNIPKRKRSILIR